MSARVVHFEIPFDDGDRARSFYSDVFDWSIQTMPELDYTIVSTGPADDQGMPSEPGYIGGGMMQRQDADRHARDHAGGRRHRQDAGHHRGERRLHRGSARWPVAEMGFAAYFRDSEGNLMGLWQNAT